MLTSYLNLPEIKMIDMFANSIREHKIENSLGKKMLFPFK